MKTYKQHFIEMLNAEKEKLLRVEGKSRRKMTISERTAKINEITKGLNVLMMPIDDFSEDQQNALAKAIGNVPELKQMKLTAKEVMSNLTKEMPAPLAGKPQDNVNPKKEKTPTVVFPKQNQVAAKSAQTQKKSSEAAPAVHTAESPRSALFFLYSPN